MATHSLLTEDQREYLKGNKELDDNHERSMRGDIRERLYQVVLDFSLLIQGHTEGVLELNEELEMALEKVIQPPENPPKDWNEEFSAQAQVDKNRGPKKVPSEAIEGIGILLVAKMFIKKQRMRKPFTKDSVETEELLTEPECYISVIEKAIKTACYIYGIQAYDFEMELDFDTADGEEVPEIPLEELREILRGGGATLPEIKERIQEHDELGLYDLSKCIDSKK